MNARCSRAFAALAVVVSSLLLSVATHADDWPQWRGLNRDGMWRETGILDAIPASGLSVRWRAKVGAGYSGPVVAQERVFINDHLFDPEVERVVCFDERTGRQLWAHAYSTDYKDMEYGNGPRASPTVHDGKVYSLGTQGHLVCLDAAKGDVVWRKHLVADLHGQIPRYGASAAPLVSLIVSWPGVIQPGTRTDAMVSWIDLLPTFIEIAGGSAPTNLDGRSFAAVLTGRTNAHRDRIFTTHSADRNINVYPIRSVRTRDWHFILNLHPEFAYHTHIDLAPRGDKPGY